MTLSIRNRTLLAKIETTYGTDATPIGADDGVLLRSLDITPLELETVENTLVRPYMGAFQQLIAARSARLTVEVPMTGFGSAGPAVPTPGLDALFRACALAQDITADTSVAYTPVSTQADHESVTLYAYMDGVLHKITGARGTVTFVMNLREVPVFRFELQGLYVPPVDADLVQPDLSAYRVPQLFIFGNSTIANFLGAATGICLNSLEIALGNTLTYRNLVNCAEEVLITDRQTTGSFEIEATLVATKNIWSIINSVSLSAINLTHGTAAGNRVQLASSVAQAINPSFGDSDNIVTVSGDLRFVPSAADNELTLTVL